MFAFRHRHCASDCAGRWACSARCSPDSRRDSGSGLPGQLHPDMRGTEEVPGYAYQLLPSSIWMGCRAVYGSVDRFNAQLVSRWNNPACHPHNAVHSRGKGICTMPHLFCGHAVATPSCRALSAWRHPLSPSLALSLSLSHPDPIVQMPALSISKLLGSVNDKTTAAHCERVDQRVRVLWPGENRARHGSP